MRTRIWNITSLIKKENKLIRKSCTFKVRLFLFTVIKTTAVKAVLKQGIDTKDL